MHVCVIIKRLSSIHNKWHHKPGSRSASAMSSAKFDIDKFTNDNDFNLWRIKMNALLVHQRLEEALGGPTKLSTTLSEKEKKDLLSKAHSTIILSLGDEVGLRNNCSWGMHG